MSGMFTSKRTVFCDGSDAFGNFWSRYILQTGIAEQRSFNMSRSYSQTTTSHRGSNLIGQEVDPREILVQNNARNLRPFDRGHEFSTRNGKIILSHPKWKAKGLGTSFSEGPLYFSAPGDPIPGVQRDYDAGAVNLSYGSEAIAKTQPTKQVASLERFLAELKRDVPKLPGWSFTDLRRGNPVSRTADEYLNMVFGWQPSVSDVLQICETIVKSGDIIAQYVKDSGQQVRRQWEFQPTRTHRILGSATGQPLGWFGFNPDGMWASNYFANPQVDGRGSVSLSETVYQKYWFSGAYMYYLASDSSEAGRIMRTAQLARKLLGIEGLNLSLLYELAPFSWLLDYFVDIGTLISNIDAFSRDSLVLRYGYLMRETICTRTWTHSGVTFRSGKTGPITMAEVFTDKRRVRATPYGFGITPAQFTANQWAILAALGFTKSDKALF